MSDVRASRREREKGRVLRIRDRDVEILLAVAKMRLLRTSDVCRLFFSAPGTAQKRLRKLFDAGLLRAIVPDLASENRFALTRLGHDFLQGALGSDSVPAFRPAPRIDRRGAEHLDMLNRYRIALATSAPSLGAELRRFVPEWDLRARDVHAPLVPDAVVELVIHGRQVVTFALEIDTGTEPPGTVKKKLERYDAAAIQKRPVFGFCLTYVLIVASTARRGRNLARALVGFDHRASIGAVPFLGTDGGLTGGIASMAALSKVEGELSKKDFADRLEQVLVAPPGQSRAGAVANTPQRATPQHSMLSGDFGPRYRNANS